MKEQKWDDFESIKEFVEAAALSADQTEETQQATNKGKSRVTELRRRIEERLDSKRIALECDYLLLDDFTDEYPESTENLQ